jgi:sortase A
VIRAEAEANEVLAEARRQAAAVVADARRRLRDSVAAERLQWSGRVLEPQPRAEANPEPIWARRGRLMRNTGVLIVAFVLYQLFGTNFETDHSQQRLMTAFARSLGPTPASAANAGQPRASASPSSTSALAGTPPLPGDAVAVIQIPRLGLEQAVVEGTSVSDLRKGPGHYVGTPLPGQPGNSGIAGHRTTYGAPFNHVDELVPGDSIIVRTRAGTFRYEVAGHDVVKPTQVDVLLPKGDNRLTLTTCHPKYSARQRYVVWATLSPETPPVKGIGPGVPARPPKAETGTAVGRGAGATDSPTIVSDGSSSFHLAALPGTLFWALVLGAGWRMVKHWARSWRRAPLLASPVLAYGLLHAFRSLSHFLPSNF